MYYQVSDIDYDTDGEEIDGLPSEMFVKLDDNEDDAEQDSAHFVSDYTGWCINSLSYEPISDTHMSKLIRNKLDQLHRIRYMREVGEQDRPSHRPYLTVAHRTAPGRPIDSLRLGSAC